MANLPSVTTLVNGCPAMYAHVYLSKGATLEVVWFEGNVQAIWDKSHRSYEGFRVVALKVTDEEGEEDLLCFFDHEEDNLYTFAAIA